MKLTARAGGYSSVVGQSVLLQDTTGRVVCQLALLNVGGEDHKQKCAEISQLVVESVNRNDSDLSGYVNNRHPFEVLALAQKHLARAHKGAFFDKEACAILARALLEQAGRSDPSMVAYKIKDSRGEYWQTVVDGHAYNFSVSSGGDAYTPAPARWVKCDERHPSVGGTYLTGQWTGLKKGLRQFKMRPRYFIIHENNKPTWYSLYSRYRLSQNIERFPQYWLDGMPGAPADD